MKQTCHFLIGAASSGGGKTTFTTGLLRLFRNRGLKVQPYKCGPDYIDTKYHEMAVGNASVNLDLWLSSRMHVKKTYAKYASGMDVCVTEGVMGLFDGFDGMEGSSAAIAALLDIPVVLVVNAKSTSYTVAPIIYGFKHFNPSVRLAGVVFNQVASERHFSFLQKACEDVGVECFGFLPRLKELEVPSRHLGLTLDTSYQFDKFASVVAQAIEDHVAVDRILEVCCVPSIGQGTTGLNTTEQGTTNGQTPTILPESSKNSSSKSISSQGIHKIAVAQDAAFNFIYQENLARLKELGTVTFFSPISDECLPDCDLVYLPGGYPEFFLTELERNLTMKQQLKAYVESGGRLLAECGGMMYLCESIRGMDGKVYDMVGVLHQRATMENMKLRLGYRTLQVGEQVWKGHEFHYSSIEEATSEQEHSFLQESRQLSSIAKVTDAKGNLVSTPLYRYKNLIAGYTHLYWGEMELMKLWNV